MAAPPRPARKMDRSWVFGVRHFSKAHLDGVRDFMQFVSERFDENEQIFCPCRKCLNRIRQHKGVVKEHLYIHGMSSTYDKWVYHGESLDAEINENVGRLDARSCRQACDTDEPTNPSAGLSLTRQQTHESLGQPHPHSPTKLDTMMGIGQKLGTRKQSPAEAPICEHEKVRAVRMMRNDEVFQTLGVSALASMLNNSAGQSKSKVSAPEDYGSLYEPGDTEDREEGVVDKGSEKAPSNTLTRNVTMPSGGRVSKRVVALEEEDQPARMTRQRTGELSSTEENHHERTTIPEEGSTEDGKDAARIQELEVELDAKKQVTADLRVKVENLMKHIDDSEWIKQLEEMKKLRKTLEEVDALLRGSVSLNKV